MKAIGILRKSTAEIQHQLANPPARPKPRPDPIAAARRRRRSERLSFSLGLWGTYRPNRYELDERARREEAREEARRVEEEARAERLKALLSEELERTAGELAKAEEPPEEPGPDAWLRRAARPNRRR